MAQSGWRRACGMAALAMAFTPLAGAQTVPAPPHDQAARLYDAACSSCHYRGGGRAPFGTRGPQMEDSPDALINVILFGRSPKPGKIGMPAFGPALTDADISGLVTYLRAEMSPTPWTGTPARITDLRQTGSREDD